MNKFVQFAQAGPIGADAVTGEGLQALNIVQPHGHVPLQMTRLTGQIVDFSAILQADISFFRIDEALQLFFSDGSSIVIYNFFGGDQTEASLILGDGVKLSIDRFVALASVEAVDELQTAAGPTTSLDALLEPDGPGANFQPTEIDDLGPGLDVHGLLGPIEFGRGSGGPDRAPDGEVDSDPSIAFPANAGLLAEANLPDGSLEGGPLIVSGNLGIDFAEDGDLGRTLEFDVAPSGLPVDQDGVPLDLTSDGISLVYAIVDNDDGGQTLTATRNGETVFTVTLFPNGSVTGSYTFTLFDNLDHIQPQNDASVLISFGFTAGDFDGDTIGSAFGVTIADDAPVLGDPDDALVDEDDLSMRAPGSDEADGVGDQAAGDDDTVTDVDLEIDAGDTDPTTVRGNLNIVFGADNTNSVVDGGTSIGNGDRAVTFSEDAVAGLEALGLTSQGVAVIFAVSGNGTRLTATADGRTVFTVILSDQDTGSYLFDLHDVLDHPVSEAEDDIVLTFGFTVTDSDGDIATSSFNVTVDDDLPMIGDPESALVDEDDLAVGDPQNDEADGIGDTAAGDDNATTNADLEAAAGDTDPSTVRGDLSINFGADDGNSVIDGGISTGNGDRSVIFSAGAIAALEALDLTSHGQALTYALSGNDAELTATADGRTIFTITLSDQETGSYVFDLNDVLDHATPDTEDNIVLTFGFTVTDSDGDTATSSFDVSVDDDLPVIGDPESALVDEDDLAVGAPQNNEADGVGDTAAGDDDTMTNAGLEGAAGDTDPSTVRGNLSISFGSDDNNSAVDGGASTGNGDRSVTFSAGALAALEALDLTSHGQTLAYALSGNGSVLTASAGGRTVFTVSLSDQDSGSYLFDLMDVLDHALANTEDNIVLTFGFTVTDSDGDSATSSFNITVDDDLPRTGDAEAARVDEDDLATGGPQNDEADGNADNAGGDDDPRTNTDLETAAGDSDPTTVRGNLGIDFGADDGNSIVDGGFSAGNGDRAVTFSPDLIASLELQGLTSHGDPVTYILSGEGTVLTASAGARTIFTVTLSDQETGSYLFDLNDALDHPIEGFEDNIFLTFDYTVTDSDGDTATGSFEIDIDDDLPVIGASQSAFVDEEGSFTGNPGDSYPDPFSGRGLAADLAGENRFVGGSLGIFWGADDGDRFDIDGQDLPGGAGNRSVTFADFGTAANNLVDGNGDPLILTSNGIPLVYTISNEGTVLGARAGANGPFIFSVELLDDDSGSYRFGLIGHLDHPGIDIEDDLEFFVRFTATDSDGDTASSAFAVTVNDDAPVIDTPASTLVDEDDLPNGVGDMAAGDDDTVSFDSDGAANTVGGSLDIAWGADDGDNEAILAGPGNRSVAFNNLVSAVNNVTVTDSAGAAIDLGAGDLTSDGEPISFALIDGQTLVAFTGAVPPTSVSEAGVVFHVALSDDLDGSYLFTLVRKLDHPLQDDPDGGGDDAFEDNLNFTFGFTATDSDGDSADGAFTVIVDDDSPAVTGAPVFGTVDETVLADIPPEIQTLFFTNPSDLGGPDFTVTHDTNVSFAQGGGVVRAESENIVINSNDDGRPFILNSLFISGVFGPGTATFLGYDAAGNLVATQSIFTNSTFSGAPTGIFDPTGTPFENVPIDRLEIAFSGSFHAVVDNVSVTFPGVPGTPAIDTQDLSSLIADGADEPAGFTLKTFDALDFGAVTAFGGQQVRIVSDGTALTAFVDNGNAPGELDAGDTEIFTLTLSPQGEAVFTLLEELDHNLGPQLDLDFGPLIDVTDTDGDTIPLNSGDYVVTVNSPSGDQPPVAIDDPGIGGESVEIAVNGFQTPVAFGSTTTMISDTTVEVPLSGFDISSNNITFTAPSNGFSNFLVFLVDAESDFTGFSTPTGDLASLINVSLNATGNFVITVNQANLVAGVSTFSFDFTTDRVIGVDVNATSANLHDLLLTNDSDPNGDPIDIVGIDTTGTTGSVFFDDATDTLQYTASGFSLAAGEQVIDTFTYTLTDRNGGLDTATVSITVTGDGQNTPAIIAGNDTGIVVEDTTLNVSGVLTVTDPDPGEAVFIAASGLAGAFGTLDIDANGNWTYVLDNDLAAVQALNDGESLIDAITVQTADGTTHQVDIAIQGIDEDGGDAVPLVLRIEQNGADQIHSFLPVDRLFFEGWELTLNNAPVEINVVNSDNVTSITSDGFEFDAGEGTRFIELELSDAAPPSGTINLTFDYSAFDVLAFGFFPLGRVNHGEGPVFSLQSGGTSTEIRSYASDSDYIGFHNYESRTISFNYSVVAGVISITNLIDPIVLDLGTEGYSFATAENGVEFDLDSDGQSDTIAWTNGEDGLLAIDLDGSGAIEDGSELFTPTFGGGNFASSLDALASLDGNGDGLIDDTDAAFTDLLVWVDENNDGVSQAHEITGLADNGIASIALDAANRTIQIDGQNVLAEGSFTLESGETRSYVAVDFVEAPESPELDEAVGSSTSDVGIDDDLLAEGLASDALGNGTTGETYLFNELASAFKLIEDFDVSSDADPENDIIDLGQLLGDAFGEIGGFVDEAAASGYVRVTQTDTGAGRVAIDPDGGGDAWTDIAVINDLMIGETIRVVLDGDGTQAGLAVA